MTSREKEIQDKILEAIYEELEKQNLTKDDCLEYITGRTILKESRIKSILSGENKRAITLKEVFTIAFAFNVHPAYLFRKVERSKIKPKTSKN
ncbi:MAG: hypothetical protein E7159_01225 [Firmicutes bacterium]|nr:hypothetical protein [Bacillota bacterium]